MPKDMVDGMENPLGMSVQFMVEVVMNHSVLLQNGEHLANCSLMMDGGVVDDGVESVYEVHVGDLLVHVSLIEGLLEVTF